MNANVLILAAGQGTRMKSNHAKVMHQILGKPMVQWIVDAARAANAAHIVVIVGSHGDEVREQFADQTDVVCVEQTEQLGTGHAVRVALEETGINAGPVVVLNGDLPLIQSKTIKQFAALVSSDTQTKSITPAAAILTMTPPDPYGYGRIELDQMGAALRIIEQKDCTPEQSKTLVECNVGCYAFDGAELAAHIGEITSENVQHEYYLTDMLEILRNEGDTVTYLHLDDYREGLGVNDRAQLAELSAIARDRINAAHMAAGVSMLDPTAVWIGPDVQIGRDTIILPQTMLMGTTYIGEECTIGPNTRLTNTQVGNFCVIDETVAEDVQIDNHVTSGPRAYLRPGTHLCDGSKAGTHVEIKKSTIGPGSKVPHLSYIGDTTMGANVNIGAGSITCNYDGVHKNPTTIGDNTFIGSDTMMVAPVNIGADAITGAGGTITKDVPDGALALERTDQRIVEGYTARRRARLEQQ